MLTRIQIVALNKVRSILRALQKKADERNSDGASFELGKFSEAAYQAEDALFNVLNIDNVYLDGEETDDDLHLREDVQ